MTNTTLRKINWILAEQLGIDLRKLAYAPYGFAKYLCHALRFRQHYTGKMQLMPCVHDWKDSAGSTSSEYFWQDLLVAQLIHKANPRKHVDVGSRIDGFIAHVASFREVEVFDVRPLESEIPQVTFRQADLMVGNSALSEITDSLSCLHAIEHFGLGRYGDPLNAAGFTLGLANLVNLLEPGGTLYLSCPSGDDVVHFNAHRALLPSTIVETASPLGLKLSQMWLFDNDVHKLVGPFEPSQPSELAVKASVSLAIYKFIKI